MFNKYSNHKKYKYIYKLNHESQIDEKGIHHLVRSCNEVLVYRTKRVEKS